MTTETQDRIGQEVRSRHPYAYRSGEWALIEMRLPDDGVEEGRPCWLVRWLDGDADFWACEDPDADYEFRAALEREGRDADG